MAENHHSCVSGLALIFAPVSGKEARNTIVYQFQDLKEKIRELEKKLLKS